MIILWSNHHIGATWVKGPGDLVDMTVSWLVRSVVHPLGKCIRNIDTHLTWNFVFRNIKRLLLYVTRQFSKLFYTNGWYRKLPRLPMMDFYRVINWSSSGYPDERIQCIWVLSCCKYLVFHHQHNPKIVARSTTRHRTVIKRRTLVHPCNRRSLE